MEQSFKQLFIPNYPVAQWEERERKAEKDLLAWVRIQRVFQRFCPNFHKMNKCQYFMVLAAVNGFRHVMLLFRVLVDALIPLFPDVFTKLIGVTTFWHSLL